MANPPAAKKDIVISEDQWDSDQVTVIEAHPAMISLDELGDVFCGIYRASATITDPNENATGGHDSWERHDFTGHYVIGDDGELDRSIAAELCGINGSYDLDLKMKEVPPGSLVRLELARKVKTKQAAPLKSYRIKYRSV